MRKAKYIFTEDQDYLQREVLISNREEPHSGRNLFVHQRERHPYPKAWDNELPDSLLSVSEDINFTLDSSGEWTESKTYTTVGSKVSISGEVTSPAGYTWNIKVASSCGGWSKEKDDIPTGTSVSFSVPTNFGSTELHVHVYSVNGAADAGLEGTLKVSD